MWYFVIKDYYYLFSPAVYVASPNLVDLLVDGQSAKVLSSKIWSPATYMPNLPIVCLPQSATAYFGYSVVICCYSFYQQSFLLNRMHDDLFVDADVYCIVQLCM